MTESKRHKYLRFKDNPKAGTITFVGFYLVDLYLKPMIKQSRKKWKSDRNPYILDWHYDGGEQESSNPVNYLLFTKYIRENPGNHTANSHWH